MAWQQRQKGSEKRSKPLLKKDPNHCWKKDPNHCWKNIQTTLSVCSWSHISLSMFGRSFGCKAKYDLFYAVIPTTHPLLVLSLSLLVLSLSLIPPTTHNWVQSSRNEIHSCQLSAICKYTYTNILTLVFFLPTLPHFLTLFIMLFCLHSASHWCEAASLGDARPYWISHGPA